MDQKLLAWGRRRKLGPLPCLWLFTDDRRLTDPRRSVAALPRGRAGVVLRHDHDPARATLGRDLARICRARRLVLVVAGDPRLAAALKSGMHLRGGRWPGPFRPKGMISRGMMTKGVMTKGVMTRGMVTRGIVTSSAHSVADLRRARRAGAGLVFLSPAFPTASHAGTPGLGPVRWAAIARQGGATAGALGGIDGQTVRRLPPRLCRAVGAIGALST